MAKTAVGFLTGIQKQRHVPDVLQDPRDHTGQRLGGLITLGRDIDVHPVSIPVRQRLWGKVGAEPVLGGHGADDCVEGDGVVGGCEGI